MPESASGGGGEGGGGEIPKKIKNQNQKKIKKKFKKKIKPGEGGLSAPGRGGVVSHHALRQTPPLWTESQTPVKHYLGPASLRLVINCHDATGS